MLVERRRRWTNIYPAIPCSSGSGSQMAGITDPELHLLLRPVLKADAGSAASSVAGTGRDMTPWHSQ